MICIRNFHVLNYLLLIFICKLHWNLNTMFVCQVHFLLIYICNFHVLNHLLLIFICKLHWNQLTGGVSVSSCSNSSPGFRRIWTGNYLLLIYICNFHVLSHLLFIYICKLHWNRYEETSTRCVLRSCLDR